MSTPLLTETDARNIIDGMKCKTMRQMRDLVWERFQHEPSQIQQERIDRFHKVNEYLGSDPTQQAFLRRFTRMKEFMQGSILQKEMDEIDAIRT